MTLEERYQLWCEKATDDADLQVELTAIQGDSTAIEERFSRDLEFGTAGLRGIIGAGSFRMNIYTVRRATQGLADYLKEKYEGAISVAIAYDSRHKSELFSKESACVLAANGIKAYIYPELAPTPALSFAVRELKAQGGINVTASHNPAAYNGYKVYGDDGCQMTDAAANAVFEKIQKVDLFAVPTVNFDEAVKNGTIEIIGDEVLERYLDKVQEQCVNPELAKASGLKVLYTPLNGAGNKCVRAILKRIGIDNVTVVPEQEMPDGDFPTCPYPNPEIKQVFECGLKLAEAVKPDLFLATDPDSDRVGIAVQDGDDYRLFSGNEVGAMLMDYILSQRTQKGDLPKDPFVVKTIVTTPLVEQIAKKYNCEVINVLTGFKYIGDQIARVEAKGEENRYIFGFEESYGYLAGTYVRDKDAVVASMLICEMAAYYKTQGKNLVMALNDLYREYGYCLNTTTSYEFDGLAGNERMKEIMSNLRANPPKAIAGDVVVKVSDYKTSEAVNMLSGIKTEIKLPKSNVLAYVLKNGSSVIVRPSGTEPKIKLYLASFGATKADAEKTDALLKEFMVTYMGI